MEGKKKSIFKRWWFWAVVVIIIVAVASANGGEEQSQNATGNIDQKPGNASPGQSVTTTAPDQSVTPTATPEAKKPDLELLDHKSTSDQFSSYIEGTIKNNTKKEYGYVQVEINLYDKDGAQVGSTFANTTNLEPGGTWKFKAIVLEENVASYKIKDITGF
jgi:cytoskeletal protein RodZ